MLDQLLVVSLRLIHILSGVFWVGVTIMMAQYLIPSIRGAGPAGGVVMRELAQTQRLPAAMNGATIFTLLSGIGLYWRMSSLSQGTFAHSRMGMALGLGGLLAIIVGIVGFTVSRPTAQRIGKLGAQIGAAGGPPSPELAGEMARLQAKLARTTKATAGLLVLATALMAVARYT